MAIQDINGLDHIEPDVPANDIMPEPNAGDVHAFNNAFRAEKSDTGDESSIRLEDVKTKDDWFLYMQGRPEDAGPTTPEEMDVFAHIFKLEDIKTEGDWLLYMKGRPDDAGPITQEEMDVFARIYVVEKMVKHHAQQNQNILKDHKQEMGV